MYPLIRCLTLRRAFFVGAVLALALAVALASVSAGGYGERLSNGSFEEGFAPNGVAVNWTGFDNGGAAFYHYQDDTAPAFAYDGKHSQLLEISTMPYFVTDPERTSGIYQTVAVVAGTPYTLTLHGMLRVLSDDPDMNNWSYVVQWGIDPNGSTNWSEVSWNDVPWGTTYDWIRPGPIAHFATTFTAPSNKITLFVRALKKFPTRYRDLFVNLDGISLVGALPAGDGAPALDMVPPTFVYTTKPFRVHVTVTDTVGIPQVKLFDQDKLVASQVHKTGPLAKDIDLYWTPALTGTRTLKVEATNEMGKATTITKTVRVVPIVEFLKNGDFEGGFVANALARQWGFFHNGGRNVWQVPYDDTWKPVVASGAHSQLIEINTTTFGERDPYQEPDRYAGICQVVTGLTLDASYYVSAKGMLRVSEVEKPEHLEDWSYVAQWGSLPVTDPNCSAWETVTNWQTIPWQHVDYRESPTRMNTFSTVIIASGDTFTFYFRAWKKWAVGAREMLLNFDDVSVAGYKEPPESALTPTPSPTPSPTVSPTPSPTSSP